MTDPTDRADIIAAALRTPNLGRPYVGCELRGPLVQLLGPASDPIWTASVPQLAEAIDNAIRASEEKDTPAAQAAGTTSTPRHTSNKSPADHKRITAELRAAPGQWRTVGIYSSRDTGRTVASNIRRAAGVYGAYSPAGHFEARNVPGLNGTAVEARYIGAADSPGAPDEGAR
ncbi:MULTISPECIES: hypothetical protein [Streptomyces]|uniref:hypothetical protein n=1 Tax=Streptomyces TaxID=1883 RepID=UPI0029A9E1ED|nr:hypothetical protein [Streptomyces stelliscabiei]MDX2520546.1 hypothetical protein [Streptomyces stelliscabiei]MDX2552643.1 hypothetical protein [Streptomyces stelliscabiei]MDX2661327.1 hypothetical protein [Streptomyces stelliscabiei]MDX2788808.1 hypothetical protein [Streptomyces stelliscabiei]